MGRAVGVGDGSCPLPQIRAKTIFSGIYHVKFGHFVNFFGHISCNSILLIFLEIIM